MPKEKTIPERGTIYRTKLSGAVQVMSLKKQRVHEESPLRRFFFASTR